MMNTGWEKRPRGRGAATADRSIPGCALLMQAIGLTDVGHADWYTDLLGNLASVASHRS